MESRRQFFHAQTSCSNSSWPTLPTTAPCPTFQPPPLSTCQAVPVLQTAVAPVVGIVPVHKSPGQSPPLLSTLLSPRTRMADVDAADSDGEDDDDAFLEDLSTPAT